MDVNMIFSTLLGLSFTAEMCYNDYKSYEHLADHFSV